MIRHVTKGLATEPRIDDHDFRRDALGLAIPYDIYDTSSNPAFLVLETSHEPSFCRGCRSARSRNWNTACKTNSVTSRTEGPDLPLSSLVPQNGTRSIIRVFPDRVELGTPPAGEPGDRRQLNSHHHSIRRIGSNRSPDDFEKVPKGRKQSPSEDETARAHQPPERYPHEITP